MSQRPHDRIARAEMDIDMDVDAGIWRRWMRAWDIVFYAALLLGLVVAVREDFRGADDDLVVVGLVAASAFWYGYFGDVRKLWARGRGWAALFLTVEATLWLSLMFLNPIFMFAGFGMLAHVCGLSPAWSYVVAAILGGGMILQEATEQGPIAWTVLVNAAFVSGVTVILYRLIYDIAQRSQERQRMIAELETTRADLAAAEREAGTLAERHRLARDIHDTLAQGFTSIVMLLEAAEGELVVDPSKARTFIDQARSTARASLAEARGLVWALRSERLTAGSLVEALQSIVSELSEETPTRAEFVVTGEPNVLPDATEECILRVAQEALANVRKHAEASRVTVTLSYLEDGVSLDVRDDGVGFEPATLAATGDGLSGGMGLQLMLERVQQLGGTRLIESSAEGGTAVVVQLRTEPEAAPRSSGAVGAS